MTIGDLVLVSSYIVQLLGPIAILGFVYGQYKNSFADLNAMIGILNQPVTITEPSSPKNITAPSGVVEFRHVRFAYNHRRPIFDNLSFSIQPGEDVAFVGPSGAGKSTITKLLFRLYDINAGEMNIDGVNVKDLSSEGRRRIFAIVPQEPALFNDTILNNIAFSQPEANLSQVEAAAKAAHIHPFIASLPDGYKTRVGERGIKISGGQKQRVAIARAILKNPKILVFDEATSSLDTKVERDILATLADVARGRTTIAIAHRLSTIVGANRIFVLDAGKIVEVGTHRELLAKDGVYAKMWRLQSHQKRTSGKP